MLLVLPTEGSDADLWDTLLNTVLGGVNGVDAHDHTPGRGKRVPVAGLDVDGDLPLNAHRVTTVTGIAFQALAGMLTAGALEVFVGVDNNLYYRNGAGVNVRITNGNTLDVTSVGGIGGDYAAVGAEVAYVDASDTYTMRQQLASLVRQYARVACGGLDLYEYRAAGATPAPASRVRLSSPAALAASLELVMPAALPAPSAQRLLQVSTAVAGVGQVLLDNVVPEPVTLSGLATLNGGAVVGPNLDVVVSGTGRFKHGTKTKKVAVLPAQTPVGSLQLVTVSSIGLGVLLPMEVGERILRLRFVVRDAVGGANTVYVRLASAVAGSAEALTGAGTPSSGTNTLQTILSAPLTTTVVSGSVYRAVVSYNSGGANFEVYDLEVDYDRP